MGCSWQSVQGSCPTELRGLGVQSASSESPTQRHLQHRKQPGSDRLVVTSQDGITTIRLNRPTKRNALTTQMYHDITAALQAASKDESAITVLTGSEDYYCSGTTTYQLHKSARRWAGGDGQEQGGPPEGFRQLFHRFPKASGGHGQWAGCGDLRHHLTSCM